MTRMKTTADARHQHRTNLSLEAIRRELTPQERHEWNLIHDADLAAELEQQVARLEAEVERLDAMGIHTCSDTCQKLPCVQRRRIRELEAENARLREAMSNLRVVVRQMPSHQIAMTVIAHVDSALAPQPATEAKPDDLGLTHCSKHNTYRDASKEPCWQCHNEKEAKPSGFVPRDGDPNHDMTIGPCQCGAWHKEGDLP